MTFILTTATTTDEADRDAQVALLPVGSCEQHGPYLPLITDTIVACTIANAIAERHPVQVLPPITISCSHEHAAWRGTVSISARTLHAVVTDIADSLRQNGVERLAIISGHGGNYVLSNVVQEYTAIHGPVMCLYPQSDDWTAARRDADMETDSHTDMHAGEFETSVLLCAARELVRTGYEDADWSAEDRRHLLTLGMTGYTASGVVGRPSQGTADKGERCLATLAAHFSSYFALLADPASSTVRSDTVRTTRTRS